MSEVEPAADPGPDPDPGLGLHLALDQTLSRRPRLGRTRLVCVDGPAGSGKTTFAARLADAAQQRGLEVAVVHMDDVYAGWGGLPEAGARVLQQIVVPLAAGRPAAYARYDWHAERFGPLVAVPVVDLLVLEGVGSGDPGYQEHIGVLVWVSAPEALRMARGLERDGAALEGHWRRWMVEEERLHARDRTRERADVLVDGRSGKVSLVRNDGA